MLAMKLSTMLFLAVSLLVAAPQAMAATPAIDHVPPTTVDEGAECTIRATIRAPGGVLDARVFWRVDDEKFGQAALVKVGKQFEAKLSIPGSAAKLEYFMSATDKKSLAEVLWKSREDPQRIAVTRRAVAAPVVIASVAAPAPVVPAIPAPTLPAPVRVERPAAAIVAKPAPAAIPAAPKRKRVMVLGMTPIGVDPRLVAPLPDLIAADIGRHAGYEVASADDVRRVLNLEETKQQAGCAQEDDCLAQIGNMTDVDLFVISSLGRIGESYVLNLTLTTPGAMGTSTRATETIAALQDLPGAAARAVATAFKWNGAAVPKFQLPKGEKLSFAVFDLNPTGLSPDIAQNLTQILSVEVKGIEGATVVSRSDLASMLAFSATKQSLGCSDDSCLAELTGALGVERMIVGDAGKLGNAFIVNLRIINVRSGLVENRVTETFEGAEEQLLHAVRHAARNLLGLTSTRTGQIAITTSQNEARVFVDEFDPMVAPALIPRLALGAHAVRVEQEGFFDWRGAVYVDPSETTAVWAQLTARPVPWYQEWWVWALVGTAVAGGTTAAIVVTREPPKTSTGTVFFGNAVTP